MLKSNDSINKKALGEKGAGKAQSESAHHPPLGSGFDSRSCCHMWIEFVVGSRPCSEGFSPGSPVFHPLQKPTFQIQIPNLETVDKKNYLVEYPLLNFHYY